MPTLLQGWGLSAWGTALDQVDGTPATDVVNTSVWGLGVVSVLYIVGAYPTTIRSLVVELSTPPRALSAGTTGDALNPSTWTVTKPDGVQLPVFAVRRRSAQVFELLLGRPLGPEQGEVVHTITSVGLLAIPATSAMQVTQEFAGLAEVVAVGTQDGVVDFANPPFPDGSRLGGTFLVDDSGGYAMDGGEEFLRKIIIRRLQTMPGEFFHMPDYGLGLRLKEPLQAGDLLKLKRAADLQLLREPEFSEVRTSLVLAANGTLSITVALRLASSNQEVVVPINVPSPLVTL